MTTLSLASAPSDKIKSEGEKIAEMLESYAAEIRSGERTATHCIIGCADLSDVENFRMVTNFHGRTLECLGLLDLCMMDLRGVIVG